MVPAEEEALELLQSSGCSPEVIQHCKAVHDFASRVLERLTERGVEVDERLVRVGALLHDLGRCRTHRIDHGVVGGRMARKMGFSEGLARIIERHIGAGIEAGEASALGLPSRDLIPRTLEEKIVAAADNMIRYDKHPIDDTLRKLERKGHSRAAEKVRDLHRELSELAGIDLDEL